MQTSWRTLVRTSMQQSDLPQGRVEALYKLLSLGPEPMSNLVRCTGWPESQTKLAVDLLIASNRVCKVHRRGSVPVFLVRARP